MLLRLCVRVTLVTLRSDEGATALEYGLLVALIAIVIVVGIAAFGDELLALFESNAEQAGEILG